MKQLLKKAKFLSIFLVAISYLGCEDIENLFPAVTSGFTYTITDQGTVTFINTSEEARTYIWDFGDGDSSTEINPVKSYAASGTYTVTLKASNIAGDSDTSEDQLTVNIITPADPCTEETEQSLDATDFDLTFQTDPGASVGSFDAVLTTIANPDFDNAVNPSCQVGQIDRNGSALFANNQIEFDAKFDFNANSGFKLKVWSPVAGTNVLVKLEDKADAGINTEVGAVTTTASAWEELTFDFASSESGKYDKIILFFELNTNTTETYYIDDFALYGDGGGATCTAETGQSLDAIDFDLTFQTDPGASVGSFDAVLTTIANPDFDNAVNPSCQVGQIDRNGSALFANNQIEFDAKFDFNANSGFKLKVWSPVAGTNVLVKLEDKADAGINTEVGAVTTTASAWEELTFDFASSESGKYDKIILFFELNTNTTETYYIDDFALYGDGGGATCTAETGQSLDATDFDLTFQTDPGASVGSFDAVLTTIANPDFDNAVNPSCQVGQIDRNGSALFANNQIEFDAKFDFNANSGFKLKVWSPVAGTNVLVKLEDKADAGINTEVGAVTTTASAWEELTFDFASSESGKYDKIILFFELNTNTTETYYIDDFRLYGSGGSSGSGCTGTPVAATSLPLDFEGCESFVSSFSSIGDGGVTPSLDTNPSASGINTSDNVLKVIRASGINRWGGIQNSFPSGVIDITTKVFKIKVYSSVPDVTYRFELALDPQTDPVTGNPAPVFRQVSGGANTWTELEFTFINLPATPTTYNQLVIKPDNPDGSDGEVTTEERVFYFDDLRLE